MIRALAIASTLVLPAAAPTPAERTACTPDAVRFCMAYVSSQANMVACLQAHRAELTPECRAVIRTRKGK